MSEKTISGLGGIDANLSPDAFHRWAIHYYKCKQDFQAPHRFSPVPYFLLCRCIELEIKSWHLTSKRQREVKKDYGHNLILAYNASEAEKKILTSIEIQLLELANDIYRTKGFEYFTPEHALRGFTNYPDLQSLDAIANKLINHSAPPTRQGPG